MEFPDPVERNPLRAAALSILPFLFFPFRCNPFGLCR
jgi:hypothetical protein